MSFVDRSQEHRHDQTNKKHGESLVPQTIKQLEVCQHPVRSSAESEKRSDD